MGTFSILADALMYPAPGSADRLASSTEGLPAGAVRDAFVHFLSGIKELSLGEWEELHTRTLDLDPPAAPYIGFQTWGDSYQRGTFMSMLNRALTQHEVDTAGELPDHLIPVLRLLDTLPEPFSELEEVFQPALERIRTLLTKVEPQNPYNHLLTAIAAAGAGKTQADPSTSGKK